MFPGLSPEINQILSQDYKNLQVLHEALSQAGGLQSIAQYVAGQAGVDETLVAAELRLWRQSTERDMMRERRMLHQRIVRPRLLETTWSAETLQETYLDLLRKEAMPVRKVCKTRLSQSLVLEAGNPLQVAEEERVRWAMELAQYFKEAGLPIVKLMEESEDPSRSWARIFGTRRAKTLRNRATVWKKFFVWLQLTRCRAWPEKIGDVVDYLEGRISDGCGPTVPQNVLGALALMESVGRVEDARKLTKDRTLLETVRNMQMELQHGSEPKKQAKPPLIAMIIGLEFMVGDNSYKQYEQLIAWVSLLMVWMTLRADDVQWIDPNRMHLDGFCLKVVLTRTKTTGAGRRAVEVPAFVARDASISGEDWLGRGWDLFRSEAFHWEREYFLPAPSKDWERGSRKFLGTEALNSYLRYVITLIKKPLHGGRDARSWMTSRDPLIEGELATFWSGHSARHWLPTHAANVGIGKEQRDFLGRWQAGAQESNAYILSAKQAVLTIQREVNRLVHENLTESEIIGDLQRYARDRGVRLRDERWFFSLRRKQDGKKGLFTRYPALVINVENLEDDELGQAFDHHVPLEERAEEEGESGRRETGRYWVSISRKTGFRRLHKRGGCGIMIWNVASYEEFGEVHKASADAWCKICFREELKEKSDEDSSTSGSSSSTDEEL